jgi:hypothetical protein
MWVLYFAVVLFGIGLMAVSVGRNVLGTPGSYEARGRLPSRAELRSCLVDLELLLQEQNQRGLTLAVGASARDPIEAWNTWSRDWEKRLGALQDRCALSAVAGPDAKLRGELALARDSVLALHRAYSEQLNRFAEEQAEHANAAAQALARAREQMARER